MYSCIVVGTDGSPTAAHAVARAIALAKLYGAELHIVSGFRPPTLQSLSAERMNLPDEFAWQISTTTEVDRVLDRAKRLAGDSGVNVSVHAVEGDPVEAILSTAEGVEADVIVVGSKGMERRLMGSVPNSVAHRARKDVLIVNTT